MMFMVRFPPISPGGADLGFAPSGVLFPQYIFNKDYLFSNKEK
jgi:hypothetical protein